MSHAERTAQIAARLTVARERITAAALGAGRDPLDVHLVVVTKTRPIEDIAALAALGARDLGENRHQEAEAKAALTSELGIRWHFVGQIQSNKAARIAAYADVVHAVDSVKVAKRLDRGTGEHGRGLGCFVQVNLDRDAARSGRGGAVGDEVDRVADAVAAAPALRLLGVMGVAPYPGDPRMAFSALAETSHRLSAQHPDATAVSAGMSDDFEVAIGLGATHVRIGALVLGPRPPLG
jgi:pyridoxal phosphate enzyme (YggS family)